LLATADEVTGWLDHSVRTIFTAREERAAFAFEVLQRLNEFAPRLRRIPFVFLTALANRESKLKGRRLGADDYVTKPITRERRIFCRRFRDGLWPGIA
jgi:response regulator RpfG family c-di-GMP phosphodiesterase